MKSRSWIFRIIISLTVLITGLMIGLGHGQVKKEQLISYNKLKEANRKVSFMRKKIVEVQKKAEVENKKKMERTVVSMEQKQQTALDKLRYEKNNLRSQLKNMKEMMQKRELKIKESGALYAGVKKELQKMESRNRHLNKKLKNVTVEKNTIKATLKKMVLKSNTTQARLQATGNSLGQCRSDNAAIGNIAEDLVIKYRDKGLGAVFLQKEPLTQIQKVKVEQIVQQYSNKIEDKKIRRKHVNK